MSALEKDILVIGAGIAGLQAALDAADLGASVLVVERAPSIGGKMIGLSKVFPTLDCASCITTPRMASASHHPRVEVLTWAELRGLRRAGGGFEASVTLKPRYVDEKECISCRRCEEACPVYVSDPYEQGLGARKAISIPFTNAVPQLPVLDPSQCMRCGACARACPKDCIDFLQEPREVEVRAKAVIVATGFETTPMTAKKEYGMGRLPNVLSPLQAERLLAPHGPYGRVLRPSDGKAPDSIAYVQCAGSRDKSIGVPYCSRVCCMYAIKQAVLLSGSLPTADIVLYYMDIRAFGKGYEQFYSNAKAMGIRFVKAKVARVTEDAEHNPVLRVERLEGDAGPEEVKHDLVVLSQGLVPAQDPGAFGLARDDYGFAQTYDELWSSAGSGAPGVFLAGAVRGPRDIPDSVLDGGSAAAEAVGWLRGLR